MTDKWYLQDLEQQISYRKRMVIIDPKGQCEFYCHYWEVNLCHKPEPMKLQKV